MINITTGGGHGMTVEERLAARTFKPELCSLNMGSMNFGLFPMIAGVKDFQHDWEPRYLEMTRDFIFRNTFKDIETIVARARRARHALRVRVLRRRPPLHARALPRARLVKPPLFVQTIFGILGGIGPTPRTSCT